jgi:hypothetical protein
MDIKLQIRDGTTRTLRKVKCDALVGKMELPRQDTGMVLPFPTVMKW